MPEFSVIVPIYKVEEYLRQCLDSILTQTFTDFELILVDDGSPDGCPAICDEYAAKDSRVTVIHQPNQGVTAARRAGLDRAQADYVCFVDGDDTIGPDWLKALACCAEENCRPDILITGFTACPEGGQERERPVGPEVGYYDRDRMEREILPYMLYDRRRHFYRRVIGNGFLVTKICRRQLLRDHFISDTRIVIHEDVAMAYECIYAARTMYVCPITAYYYRIRKTSTFHQYRSDYLQQLRWCADYMFSHLGTTPEMAVQVNAYFVYRVMSATIRLFSASSSLPEALRRFRAGMKSSRLASVLRLEGLPLHLQIFILLLKCRLYALAALSVRLRRRLGS